MNRLSLSLCVAMLSFGVVLGYVSDDVLGQDAGGAKKGGAVNDVIKPKNTKGENTGAAIERGLGITGNGASKLGDGPGKKKAKLIREGQFVTRRRGRLLRGVDGGDMMFAFESDTKENPQAPMFLLPCRQLEALEASAKKFPSLSFYVTGQVYVYKEQNYMMLKMYRMAVKSGNLSK